MWKGLYKWRKKRRGESEGKDVQEEFVYEGFGFPVVMVNVPMAHTRGDWTHNLNPALLERLVAHELAQGEFPLTGNHLQFIRCFFKVRIIEAATLFGVKQSAWLSWEAKNKYIAGVLEDIQTLIRQTIMCTLEDFDDSKCKTTLYLMGENPAPKIPPPR